MGLSTQQSLWASQGALGRAEPNHDLAQPTAFKSLLSARLAASKQILLRLSKLLHTLLARRKPAELIHVPQAAKAGIQVIKRFTGGGTVVVDEDTLFMTLIFQVDVPHIASLSHPRRQGRPCVRRIHVCMSVRACVYMCMCVCVSS